MQQIDLLAIASQTLNVDLEENQFAITIREANGCMVADVNIDGTDIVTGSRILTGEPIIPYGYLQNGNLLLLTTGDALPYWDQFGTSQILYYLTDAEMADG